MTGQELAALLRTNQNTVRYWRHTGYGPRWIKVGRRVLYDRREVDAWIESLDGDRARR